MLLNKAKDTNLRAFERMHKQQFMHLPPELHLQIISYLSYPDALALKHTNSYFYSLVRTNVQSRRDWIIERLSLGLAVPWRRCELRTDESFCTWDVRRTMERRRRHLECKREEGGCLVVVGASCHGGTSEIYWRLRAGTVFLKGVMLEHYGELIPSPCFAVCFVFELANGRKVLVIGMTLCILAILFQIISK